MSLLLFRHQIHFLLNAFLRGNAKWQLCNWLKTFSLNLKGTTSQENHNKQPFSILNPFYWQTKSLNFFCFSHQSSSSSYFLFLPPLNAQVSCLIIRNLFHQSFVLTRFNSWVVWHLSFCCQMGMLIFVDNLIKITTIFESVQ